MSPRFRSATLGVAWRTLNAFFKNPAFLLPSLIFPLFFFTAFAGGLSAVGKTPGFHYPDYTQFQFVFVLLQASAFGGVFTGFALAASYENGFGRRLMLATDNRLAILVGYALAATVRAVFNVAFLFAVALITGMDISGSALDVAGLISLGLIINMVGALFACGIALRFQTIQAGPLMQTPVFLILFLAPVYTPRALLTGWIHAVANVNPITPLIEAGRGLMFGHPVSVTLAYLSGAALFAVMAVWGVRSLRRAERTV